jgi:hypothetical protein
MTGEEIARLERRAAPEWSIGHLRRLVGPPDEESPLCGEPGHVICRVCLHPKEER